MTGEFYTVSATKARTRVTLKSSIFATFSDARGVPETYCTPDPIGCYYVVCKETRHQPLLSYRHYWTFQRLYLLSHTDTAGHTKAFDYPVTYTQLDIPQALITQSHRHGWTYQLRPLITQPHRQGWTYQKAFHYPVT